MHGNIISPWYVDLLHNPSGGFTEKKQFRDNGNCLTGDVKYKSTRFSLDKK